MLAEMVTDLGQNRTRVLDHPASTFDHRQKRPLLVSAEPLDGHRISSLRCPRGDSSNRNIGACHGRSYHPFGVQRPSRSEAREHERVFYRRRWT